MNRVMLVLIALLSAPSFGKTLAIIGPDEMQLPQTILKRVAELNGYTISYPYANMAKGHTSVERKKNDLESGALDVFWNMTNQALESELRAIKVPVFRGLFGFRIALIAEQHTHRFANITQLSQLMQYSAGSGSDWPDTDILRHNNIPVTTAVKYNNMFRMLEGGRYDYFPRGLNEPWNEIKNNSELPLSVDPYLMFRYVAPVYFFVSQNNPVGDVIESTLMQMIDNGELERLFFQDKEVQEALNRANVAQRTIFNLTNPNLPAGTPINDSRLWYNPAKEN